MQEQAHATHGESEHSCEVENIAVSLREVFKINTPT